MILICNLYFFLNSASRKKDALDYIDNNAEERSTTVDTTVLLHGFKSEKNLNKKENSSTILCHLKTRHPELYKVALMYFCTPGSSVLSERIFSSTGYLVSMRKNRLSSELIAMLTFIRCYVFQTIFYS